MDMRAQCAAVLLAIIIVATARAQVFRIQGGQSTLLNAQGGSVEFKAPNYDGTVGLGLYAGKFQFGAQSRYLWQRFTFVGGDEAIPFVLPTDIFDASHYFSVRGLGLIHSDDKSRLFVFGGATSTTFGTGFFNAAASDTPAAALFYERRLSPNLKFFSRQIVSSRQTGLEGFEWKVNSWFKTAATAGVGSNQGYAASSADAEMHNLALKASYIVAGNSFERVTVSSPTSSELTKGNIQVLYKPTEFMSVTSGHQNVLEQLTIGSFMQQASVNQFATDFHIARFSFGSGLFSSVTAGRHTKGTNLYFGRRFSRRLEFNTNWFESASHAGSKTTMLSGTVRENLWQRVSLLQLVSRTAGQTTFSFGGDFTSNRLFFRADYQNVYLPFRPERPFEQALALNASLRVAGPWQITAASDVAPDGHLRYSFGMTTYFYRMKGLSGPASGDSFSIAKYVVHGIVTDENGAPVEGIALHIGHEIAYSDSEGHFQVRFSRRGPFSVAVLPSESLTTRRYQVVSVPPEVRAEIDDASSPVTIIVRRASGPK